MFKRVLTAFLGTRHDREKKRLLPIVESIHEHEQRLVSVSEDDYYGYLDAWDHVAEFSLKVVTRCPAAKTFTPNRP